MAHVCEDYGVPAFEARDRDARDWTAGSGRVECVREPAAARGHAPSAAAVARHAASPRAHPRGARGASRL